MPNITRRIVVNSLTSGRWREETIDGRKCLVTDCVSITPDSIMNKLWYPQAVVENAYPQLDRLPAPASHPVVQGRRVSAFDPIAMNAFHIGAFVLNPRMEGGHVVNDLAIDIETANKDERGVEAMRRVREGEPIGMSTGGEGSLRLVAGERMGQPYDGIVQNVSFDHVAILLDEAPAGDATYTLVNSSEDDVIVCNVSESVNELREKLQELVRAGSGEKWAYVEDILLDPSEVIVLTEGEEYRRIPFALDEDGNPQFTGAGVAVERVVSYEPITNATTAADGVHEMDKDDLVLHIIAHRGNSFTANDKATLANMSPAELVAALHNSQTQAEVTAEQATAVLENAGQVTIPAADAETFADFQNNREDFVAYQADKAKERDELVKRIVDNSDMTEEQLAGDSVEKLEQIANTLQPPANYAGQVGAGVDRGEPSGDGAALVNWS